MRVAGSLLLVICARCACACAYTAANHGGGRPRSAGVAAHGGAGQELARDSLLTGELPPGLAAGPDVPCIESGPTRTTTGAALGRGKVFPFLVEIFLER